MKELSFIAIRLKEARKKTGMSAAEAGEYVNRSDSTIYAWENATAEPSAEQLLALCRAYDVEISYFFPPEYSAPGSGLSPDEKKLLDSYRVLDHNGKQLLLALLDYRGEAR